MWQRRRGRAARAEGPVAEECETFLSGTYEAWLEQAGRQVPGWARLNELAHGQREAVKDLAERGHRPVRGIPTWRHALGVLAAEALELAGDEPENLRRLQLGVLMPLELQLAARSNDLVVTPTVLVELARSRMHDYPSTQAWGD
ncbi:MAG: hypothetical protein ACRDYD_14125 [Acidimicrobiales bacterium]